MQKKDPYLFTLLLLAAFPSISAVLYTPALPKIATLLSLSEEQTQRSMTIFLIGYALGNLFWGPMTSRYGRKESIKLGIGFAISGLILNGFLTFFPKIWLLFVGRLLLSFGASVGLKAAYTLISDLYPDNKVSLKISSLSYSFSIGPALAILIGGFFVKHISFETSFYLNLFYALYLVKRLNTIPETLEPDKVVMIDMHNIKTSYLSKFKNIDFVKLSFIGGACTSFVYLFSTVAPFIAINRLKLEPNEYGFIGFIPYLGMILSVLITKALEGKKSMVFQVFYSSLIILLSSLVLCTFFISSNLDTVKLIAPTFFIFLGLSIVSSKCSTLALLTQENRASASSVMNFINITTSTLFLFFIDFFDSYSQVLLPWFFLLLSLIIFVFYFSFSRIYLGRKKEFNE
jgi:DHA1 family bicyclomycin/chloramphenicol resistance-like MFS transporter